MTNHRKNRNLFPGICGDRGIALLQIILIFVLVAAAIGSAFLFTGIRSKFSKVVSARGGVDGAVQAVISFAEANRVLPTVAQFPTLLKDPNDNWGQPFYYIYDNNLTSLATGGICGRTTTDLAIRSRRCTDAGCTVIVDTTYQNVAFMVVSAGPNYHNQTRMSGGITGAVTADIYDVDARATVGVVDGSGVTNLIYDDIVRVVSLNELQQQAGCFGPAKGRLQILNNELPKVCSGATTYSATLYGDGGVPAFAWSLINGPAWLTVAAGTGVLSPVGSITSTPGIYQFTFGLTDSQTPSANSTQKALKLEVITCATSAAPPGSQVSFANPSQFQKFVETESDSDTKPGTIKDNSNNTLIMGAYSQGSQYGCIWYPDNFPLTGRVGRAFFEFKFWDDPAKEYGDGFTFTLMTGANPTSVCGGPGDDIGFDQTGLPPALKPLPGKSIAGEFDTLYENGKNDPTVKLAKVDYDLNHIAVVQNWNNEHGTGANQVCDNTQTGCKDNRGDADPTKRERWFEDGVTHRVRVEVDGTNGVGNAATMKIWYNCADTACRDLTSAYMGSLPTVQQTFTLDPTMNWVKFGFTEATSGQRQYIVLSDFGIGFVGATNVPPWCILWDNPHVVAPNSTTQLSYNIFDGPANGTFGSTPAGKTGTCANFLNGGDGSCTTASLTQNTNFTLTVSNAYGNNSCNIRTCVTIYPHYYVYNNTGNKWDFLMPNGTCRAVNDGAWINNETTGTGERLTTGQKIIRYSTNNSSCGTNGTQLDTFTYNNGACADNNANQSVNWDMTDR